MKPKELMILAGGSGTRIRESIPGLPKALAPVGDKRFIDYLIRFYLHKGIERFVFCLGEFQELLVNHLETHYPEIDKIFVCESAPLGTGGAIKNALAHCNDNSVLVVNGDTYFAVDPENAASFHEHANAVCTVVLKPVENASRYGYVQIADDGSITGFFEKGNYKEGLINGGVYLLNKQMFLEHHLPDAFSFEKEYLEKYFDRGRIFGMVQDEYFIDIGIPEDLERAQTEIITYDSRLDQ